MVLLCFHKLLPWTFIYNYNCLFWTSYCPIICHDSEISPFSDFVRICGHFCLYLSFSPWWIFASRRKFLLFCWWKTHLRKGGRNCQRKTCQNGCQLGIPTGTTCSVPNLNSPFKMVNFSIDTKKLLHFLKEMVKSNGYLIIFDVKIT